MVISYGKAEIQVLFENDFCLVLNKPAGLPVQGGEGIKSSLDSLLAEKISPRPFLVHRLDRDTSGVILVAKTKAAAAEFATLFMPSCKQRGVLKHYLAICSGVPSPGEGVIRTELDVPLKGQKRVFKKSETSYRTISSASLLSLAAVDNEENSSFISFLDLELGTGRMHQIRRHLAEIGNPVLGDDKYGDFPLNKKLRKIIHLKNLLLHASALVIPPLPALVPEGLDIRAPLPSSFFPFKELLTIPPLFL